MTRLEIMADYFQIYVCDPAFNEDWSALWTDQTVDNRIVALPHTIVFGTGGVGERLQFALLRAVLGATDQFVGARHEQGMHFVR